MQPRPEADVGYFGQFGRFLARLFAARRVPVALIQLEQLRRERTLAHSEVRRLDCAARAARKTSPSSGHRPKPALHRSMNRQAFVPRAVGGGVATKAYCVR
jgi:hypothetical protein